MPPGHIVMVLRCVQARKRMSALVSELSNLRKILCHFRT